MEPRAIRTQEDLEKIQKEQRPRRPIGMMGPEEQHIERMDKEFNLGHNKDVLGALDYKAERVKQLEKSYKELKTQAEKEIGELKEMVRKLGDENLRLKKLLKEKEGGE